MKCFRLFLSESTAQRYRDLMAQPTAQMVGLIVAWNLMDVVLSPIHTAALNLLYPGPLPLIHNLVGWVLNPRVP